MHFPHLSPWPTTPDLAFLCKLLRVGCPHLDWPTLPSLDLPAWSLSRTLGMPLPDWASMWSTLDVDLSLSFIDGVLVKLRILVSMMQVWAHA